MPLARSLLKWLLLLTLLGTGLLAGWNWLERHPEHNPWAPLNLNDPLGFATQRKLAAVRSDPVECRAVLLRSQVDFETLPDAGEGECRRIARTVLNAAPLSPRSPPTTCSVAAGLELWLHQGVQPAARSLLGSSVARIEHLGAYSCRRIGGSSTGRWSEHATANAIDIAAFVLDDGRRVSVLRDWNEGSAKANFLRKVRDDGCRFFGTVLSPDYNAAHSDHLHLDQAARSFGGMCR